jgi:sugar O-acyltransferase (sialic acid O-acetyltransferase NeuD family)
MSATPTAIPVIIPLLNPNEPDARLVSLAVREGDFVISGTTMCTLETTKSTAEVLAEMDGTVKGLHFGEGDLAAAGEILCYLASTSDWEPPLEDSPGGVQRIRSADMQSLSAIPEGLRITRPALELARQAGIDLGQLPHGLLVTTSMVRDLASQAEANLSAERIDSKALVIFGGGGHGKTLIELVQAAGAYQIAGILDDGLPAGESILGVEVLGGGEMLPVLYRKGIRMAVNAIGGISNPAIREKVFEQLEKAGFTCPAVVHPSAVVEPSATLSDGVQVFSQAYIGSETRLGFGAIANTGVVVSHDCLVDDLANLSPGALLAGGVRVGKGALVGMGVTINLSVVVGAGARIGNGATIKADVPEGQIVRAGTIWPA